MRPQYEVPLTCWKCEEGGPALEAPGLQFAREELGDWKDLCPLHAATVSYVLMADTEDSLRQWYEEVCRDLGDEFGMAILVAREQLLGGSVGSTKPAELNHSTEGGWASSRRGCVTVVCRGWRITEFRSTVPSSSRFGARNSGVQCRALRGSGRSGQC